MNKGITSLKHQSGFITIGVLGLFVEKAKERVAEIIDNLREGFLDIKKMGINNEIGEILNMLGEIPQLPKGINRGDYSQIRRSRAKDEWLLELQDFIKLENGSSLLQKLYNSEFLEFTSPNDDDISFYHIEAEYNGRRFRIIFHNSVKHDREKRLHYTFDELLEKNEYVRICWY